jgi:hypothetical protein
VNIERFLLPILNWVSKFVQLFVENKSQLALKFMLLDLLDKLIVPHWTDIYLENSNAYVGAVALPFQFKGRDED